VKCFAAIGCQSNSHISGLTASAFFILSATHHKDDANSVTTASPITRAPNLFKVAYQPIAVAIPIGFERCQQLANLVLGKVFTHSVSVIWFSSFRCNWSHNNAIDQSQVIRFHWIAPVLNGRTGRRIKQNVTSARGQSAQQ
jgi:membrane glycosyltransferase